MDMKERLGWLRGLILDVAVWYTPDGYDMIETGKAIPREDRDKALGLIDELDSLFVDCSSLREKKE